MQKKQMRGKKRESRSVSVSLYPDHDCETDRLDILLDEAGGCSRVRLPAVRLVLEQLGRTLAGATSGSRDADFRP